METNPIPSCLLEGLALAPSRGIVSKPFIFSVSRTPRKFLPLDLTQKAVAAGMRSAVIYSA